MAQSKPFDMDDLTKRMKGAVAAMKHEFAGLRTGRASVSLLDPITVDAYGSAMPLNQVATVNAPESRMLTVQVWDRGLASAVDKAIRSSGLGLNPQVDGQLLRIPIPPLTEDRRKELSKIGAKYAESARVAVRNIRRDGMEHLKALEKEHQISEDEHKKKHDQVQKATDAHVKEIDEALAAKEKEIMQV
ncbi:MAG: ribosome recycling factor [Alphaproteobacteria bacterium]|jgi:ribosome recycling factor|nr:ribosome recycling factor [Alphaproteobacteria bacterium]